MSFWEKANFRYFKNFRNSWKFSIMQASLITKPVWCWSEIIEAYRKHKNFESISIFIRKNTLEWKSSKSVRLYLKTRVLRNWTIGCNRVGQVKIYLVVFCLRMSLCPMGLPKIAILHYTVVSIISYD